MGVLLGDGRRRAARRCDPRGIWRRWATFELLGEEAVRKNFVKSVPLGRWGTAEIADVVCFLASDRAAYVTGQVTCVDGGMTTL